MQTPPPTEQLINIVTARSGWRWLMQAGDLIGRYPSAFVLLALVWTLVAYVRLVPVLGLLALVLLTPALQAGAMVAFARAANRDRPQPGDLFAMLRGPQRPMLLQLGALLLMWFVLAVIIISMAVAILLPELVQLQNLQELQVEDLPLGSVWVLLMISVTVLALLSLAFFTAVPRVAFDQQPPSRTLPESIRACLKNWRALLWFGLAQLVVATAAWFFIFLLATVSTVIAGQATAAVTTLITNVVMMLLQVLVCGGQYLAWQEIFPRAVQPVDRESAPPDDHGQFIA